MNAFCSAFPKKTTFSLLVLLGISLFSERLASGSTAPCLSDARIWGYGENSALSSRLLSIPAVDASRPSTPCIYDSASGSLLAPKGGAVAERARNVAQQGFDYAVENPGVQGLNRMQLGKRAEVQATRWLRKWAARNDVPLGEGGLRFQVRGASSVPDVVFEPTKQIFDFKLTPKAVRPSQSANFLTDFPGYTVDYVFGPGPWR